jgi:MoaA/NifB/PqqE/SkfB family radical SAM enzyme
MLSHIAIVTTLRCDLKCEHCLRGFPKKRPDFPMNLLDKLLTEALPFGANHVGLTGGEPHLHPEFEAMVDKIVAYGYTWNFVTNGQQTEPYLRAIEKHKDKVSHVTVSIDGAMAETHDELRERKGAFEKAVASVKEYVSLGCKVRISSSLNQKNKGEVEALLELSRELGADGINFAGTIPTSWNADLILNDRESLELYQQIVKLRESSGFPIFTVSALYTRGGVNFCGNLNFHKPAFNPRGEMIFCCDTTESGAVTGSLRDHSLAELVKLWLKQSNELQAERAERIAAGDMGEKFDTCAFCNAFIGQKCH